MPEQEPIAIDLTGGDQVVDLPMTASEVQALTAEAAEARARHARAFLESISQQVADTFLYGSRPPPGRGAAAKAWDLLRAWLSPEQLAELDRDNCFHVIGNVSGRRYRIVRGHAQNVSFEGTPGHRIGLCFAPCGDLSEGDVMLAQKLALETRELDVLCVANPFVMSRTLRFRVAEPETPAAHPVLPAGVIAAADVVTRTQDPAFRLRAALFVVWAMAAAWVIGFLAREFL